MDFQSMVTQFGISAIFIYAAYKLYNDMRNDSLKREELLMAHLNRVAETLENINSRLTNVEDCMERKDEYEH